MEKKKMKLINKLFYKYWKKVVREWQGYSVHEYKLFKNLNELSYRNETPIYEMVSSLLMLNKESIFREDYDEISKSIMVDLSSEELDILLDISGYEKQQEDYYYIVEDRRWKILNACNATCCCNDDDMVLGFCDKLNILIGKYYRKKQEKYEAKGDRIFLKYKYNAFKVDPASGERINAYSTLFSKAIIFIVVIFGSVLLLWIIRQYINPMDTNNAILNFCNTLLAATFPCAATLITTYMLIQHEYRVDYHRERLSCLPIFSLEHVDKESLLKGNRKDKLKKSIKNVFFDTEGMDIQNLNFDVYQLSNIGYGIGFNVRHDRGDEVFCFGDIKQNGRCFIGMKKYPSLYYTIEYTDIYGNKYIQSFYVERNDSSYNIATYPPELVLRTKRLRYQQ